MSKFKIDYFAVSYGPTSRVDGYCVFRFEPEKDRWGRTKDAWRAVQTFETRKAAQAFVEEIRDLPEYL